MTNIFPPVDPFDKLASRSRKLRNVPIRAIIPNMVTLLALCAGLTSVRMTFEGRYEMAVYAVLVAALLDGLDGRLARYLRSSSRFGAELDSLSDFVSFGVAPAFLLYGWILHDARSIGWLAALIFAIAGALRLARFNAALDKDKPAWQSNFFTGVPAPAGAIGVMLPLYLNFSGVPIIPGETTLIIVYVLFVAFLMVSRIPTYSGKSMGRVRRDMILPLLVGIVFTVGLIGSYPFEMLALITLSYLALMPIGWRAFNRLARENGASTEQVSLDPSAGKADMGDDGLDEPKGEAANTENPVQDGRSDGA